MIGTCFLYLGGYRIVTVNHYHDNNERISGSYNMHWLCSEGFGKRGVTLTFQRIVIVHAKDNTQA